MSNDTTTRKYGPNYCTKCFKWTGKAEIIENGGVCRVCRNASNTREVTSARGYSGKLKFGFELLGDDVIDGSIRTDQGEF